MKNTRNTRELVNELDAEIFHCKDCGKKCNHTEGTWLPVGIKDPGPINIEKEGQPMVLGLWMQQPEVITSDKFTCYDCIN